MNDSNKEGDALWTAVKYNDLIFDGKILENSYTHIEVFSIGKSNNTKLGSPDRNPLGVDDYSKLVEELGSKEAAKLGVYDWDNEGIPKGTIFGIVL